VNKPNGVTVVASTFEDSKRFIQDMPTRRVPGIGRVLEKILREALGCSTMADVYSRRAEIHALFSPASSSFLITRSVGHGDAAHALPSLPGTAGGRKSYSQERALLAEQ
jgi:DNA polymerase kappa